MKKVVLELGLKASILRFKVQL